MFKEKLKKYINEDSYKQDRWELLKTTFIFPAFLIFFPVFYYAIKEDMKNNDDLFFFVCFLLLTILPFSIFYFLGDATLQISILSTFVSSYILASLITFISFLFNDIDDVELTKSEMRDIKLKKLLD